MAIQTAISTVVRTWHISSINQCTPAQTGLTQSKAWREGELEGKKHITTKGGTKRQSSLDKSALIGQREEGVSPAWMSLSWLYLAINKSESPGLRLVPLTEYLPQLCYARLHLWGFPLPCSLVQTAQRKTKCIVHDVSVFFCVSRIAADGCEQVDFPEQQSPAWGSAGSADCGQTGWRAAVEATARPSV